jgi:hypothetical protein
MPAHDKSQPETESMLQTLSAFNVGLGVISFALFPFFLPALAFLLVCAVPLLPLIPIGGLLVGIGALLWVGGRAIGRGISSARRGAGRRSPRVPAAGERSSS